MRLVMTNDEARMTKEFPKHESPKATNARLGSLCRAGAEGQGEGVTFSSLGIRASFVILFACSLIRAVAETNTPSASSTNLPGWLTRPLSLGDAVDLALRQNSN